MAVKKNELLKKVNEENKRISADKKMQEEYWYAEKALYARNTELSVARKEGEKEKTIEIAKKLLDMNLTIEQIMEATGLTKEEIEDLNNI